MSHEFTSLGIEVDAGPVPRIGTRLFTESRRVTLSGVEQLVIPTATLQLSLGLACDIGSG